VVTLARHVLSFGPTDPFPRLSPDTVPAHQSRLPRGVRPSFRESRTPPDQLNFEFNMNELRFYVEERIGFFGTKETEEPFEDPGSYWC